MVYRLATRNTGITGQPVPAGTVVTVGLAAANHDPAHFDTPEAFDLDRKNKRDHASFSKGAHGCLGAPLARMEIRVAIERLLARTRDVRICAEHHGPAGARRYAYEPTYTFAACSSCISSTIRRERLMRST